MTGTEKFVYDGPDVVRDLDSGGGTVADYLNGLAIDQKLRQTSGGGISYFLTDHLGTTRSLADTSASIAFTVAYDSFGNVIGGSAPTRYTYTARETEQQTGLMYYRARWYESQQGRFVSQDPVSFRGRDINLYAYTHSDPFRFVDPTGLRRCNPVLGAILGGLVGGFTGAGAGAVLGTIAGGTVGAAGGTFVIPGFGTVVGGAGGAVSGGGFGAFIGSGIGIGLGIGIGIDYCNGDDAHPCDEADERPWTPNDLSKDDECYKKCQHLLGIGDYAARYIKCYRQCKGTL